MEDRHMTSHMPLKEDAELSCNVLAQLVGQQSDAEMQRLLLQDLASKLAFLRPEARWHYLSKALMPLVPEKLREAVKGVVSVAPSPKPRADIAVVTIKKPELKAAKLAFDIPLDRKENMELNGLRYWETVCPSYDPTEDLRVVVTMVGESPTVPCALACDRLLNAYEVGACLLIGIAAGVRAETELGDVVGSELVIDYEGQRVEPDGPKKRPMPYSPDVAILRDLQHFDAPSQWHQRLRACIGMLADGTATKSTGETLAAKFHLGVILAGENLLADGSLPELRKEYHDRVRAAEMEGSGFARACQEYSKPWLVFRGISDYGDPEKPSTEGFQVVAALSAATLARLFVETEYRKRVEKEF